MSGTAELESELRARERMTLLRFITCGSVDDGKSTLIGRLLHDTGALKDDQLATLAAESARIGTQGGALDFALLVDGLAAEREQGITIDVAHRYFATATRGFIVADTPGHEQYTRNMATGASTADLAVLLVDARKGLLTQTRRHAFIVATLGVRRLVLAVNKMDLVGWDRAVFEAIEAEFRAFAGRLGVTDVTAIPLSALTGANLARPAAESPWYDGPTLLHRLETVAVVEEEDADRPLRLPVQWINRPGPDFRGIAGTIAAGRLRPGDRLRVLPSGHESRVARIVTRDGDLGEAVAGQAVTLTLADAIDVARGDLIVAPDRPAAVADQFEATVIWMGEAPLLPGRSYLMKIGTATVGAVVDRLKHRVDMDTLEPLAARRLDLNGIGLCVLHLDRAIAFDAYEENRTTGGFILIDRADNATVAAGMLRFALRRAGNIHWQAFTVDKAARAAQKRQRPAVLWFTGLSGAGKSTIANRVEALLHARGHHTYALDGDNLRHGLNRDLGFTDADRVENIRRVAEVARLMVDAGLIVLVSLISPFRADRRLARERLGEGEFLEIHVDASLDVAESRDPKGLYRKARQGLIRNFTGIDSPYEPPEAPELRIDAGARTVEETAAAVLRLLEERGVVAPE
ncbi:sulfate adenylyltransferase subunit CysN [Azospirillum sp. RWY-5-1]|uniref:Multifunctional fusion protein n=1 Tax=Azospirillum oleiclasticum TaxID=2735135 RepID=A0ABX2TMA9_9PROT|nr:sulfate adenylyltransferase subunit CysN [Azospirillum oleiclasticum]NYZ17823.1 sulfate adenylyltransferase subunit CysN [Azospirillum oleiclasticum]NYZ25045.1 sulfate adenylyltransferase subunit CysN [Azospirillum oleiclasticum]